MSYTPQAVAPLSNKDKESYMNKYGHNKHVMQKLSAVALLSNFTNIGGAYTLTFIALVTLYK